jgi:hypothetical protein
MKRFISKLIFLFGLLLVRGGDAQDVKILINHIGYEQGAPKRAVILGHSNDVVSAFKVIAYPSGREITTGPAVNIGPVDRWKDWHFWTVDFSSINTEGTYLLECAVAGRTFRSFPFQIQRDILERNTLSSVIYYFKGQRCSGLLDKADEHSPFEGNTGFADVYGGWYDATGDYGKHLGGLSFSTYFNMQPTPVAAWTLFKTYQQLDSRGDPNFKQFKRRILDEAMYGADFLVRMKKPGESFYRSVDAPGPEKRPEDRRIGKEGVGFAIKTVETRKSFSIGNTNTISGQYPFEVGWRSGAGLAVGALAIASTFPVSGQFSNSVYLQSAEDAFAFLRKNNLALNSDGKENIVDDYCALVAAVELFKATKMEPYRDVAAQRASNLMGRLVASGNYSNYWRADDGNRPFFHASDAGLPVIALLDYTDIADEATRSRILQTVRKSLEFELAVTGEVANPFGYARQLVQNTNGFRRSAFFFPHDTETAPWWQGENARLGSMSAAARLAAKYFKADTDFCGKLRDYAANQLNWILGLNPYDACMLHGAGRNNVSYMFFESYEYSNAPGGICNGITSGRFNPDDIDFNVGFAVTGKDEDWRWSEQWLPHAAWYLYAIGCGN